MSVEIAEADGVSESNEAKTQNCNNISEPLNGVSNGHHGSKHHHKSSSKDKHKDKVRDKEHKSSSKSSSSRDKHSSSSSSKDKDKHHSSSSSKDKDREKHKSSSSSGHHKSSSSHRDKDRDRHKEKDRKESSKSGGEKDKERRKEHKSSSSRDKDKDRHHKSSSSSSKSKHSSSSKSSSSKDKKELENSEATFLKPEPIIKENGDFVFTDHQSNVPTNDYDESCSGYEGLSNENKYEEKYNNGYANVSNIKHEQEINVSQASSCDYSMSQFKSDEPAFVIKEEMKDETSDEYDDNDGSTFKQESVSAIEQNEESDEDDNESKPLSKRKASSKVVYKEEDEDGEEDDDVPLSKRKKAVKEEEEEYDSDENEPSSNRKKQRTSRVKTEKSGSKKKKEQSNDEKSKKRKGNEEIKPSPTKRQKKQEGEDEEVWRWWEEEKRADGVKWTTLEHKGPVFAPPYEPLPKNVRFYYDGKPMKLSEATEEVATFYAKMLNHEYVTKPVFNDNFFKDFRKTMTSHEREVIKDLKKCNFQEMFEYFTAESEKRKNATKEEKNAKKAENEALMKEYGYCIIDGHKEKIGNFKLEPPGLFRGRGEHPKMGMVKRRIMASDVSINCGKDSKIPEPPKGQKWKDVRSDNTVTWLASWVENVQGQVKYIMLNPSSKLKGEKDHIKYETARKLDKHINKIRTTYREEWKSKEMRVRQRAVALYFIDKLALRAGNEKDEDQADTVGCCSLRVEHVSLHKQLNGKENVVVFDFLGKDSIRYYNEVEVEKRVFKNLELFMENKKEGDDLFDRLNTQVLNEHLKELMEGLTAKVFRTYNASITLQAQLDELTDPNSTIPEKLLSYNRANRAVAILCNHQRSVPKGHAKSMENLKEKIKAKREAIDDAENEYHDLKKAAKRGSVKERLMADKKQKQIERLKEQLKKLELQETDRDENKTIALGTSKLNYLDPRISVAWCKKHDVPIEKIFNKTQREKFRWAIHMADKNYRF